MNEPLVTFNHRYEAIHKVAFKMSPDKQESKTIIDRIHEEITNKHQRQVIKKNSKGKLVHQNAG